MPILKFKSQLMIGFFAAVNHGLWFVIGGFRSVLCVSVFQGSLLVIVIMIDAIVKAAFEVYSSHVCEKRSKNIHSHFQYVILHTYY